MQSTKRIDTALVLLGLVAALSLGAAINLADAQEVTSDELLPPQAEPGECYARVWVPPVYETFSEDILVREASHRIEIIPAKYDWTTEEVLVKEGYSKLEIVPAKYDWREERMMIKPAGKKLVNVSAEYGWEEEKILDRPAHTIWKKGKNPVQTIEGGTGEIMCLVEVPATHKTVRRRVLKTPATTKDVEIPAEHITIRKRVLVEDETVRKTVVPAQYKTIKVQKLLTPAKETRFEIPSESSTVTRRKLVRDGHMEWRAVLCETNMEAGLVTRIQRALSKAGHSPGSVDGVLGRDTLTAIRNFQQSKGLPQGGITMETLEALGLKTGS